MIVKHLAESNFTKMDNTLFKLSKNAYWVYGHFCNLHPSKTPNDSYMEKVTGLGNTAYYKAKKELRDNGYLFVERVGKKSFIYHIGKDAVHNIKAKK